MVVVCWEEMKMTNQVNLIKSLEIFKVSVNFYVFYGLDGCSSLTDTHKYEKRAKLDVQPSFYVSMRLIRTLNLSHIRRAR